MADVELLGQPTARALVPTPRQRGEAPDLGVAPVADVGAPDEPRGLWQHLARFLADLDPRGFGAGAAMPLAVIALTSTLGQLDDVVLGIVAPEIQIEFGFPIVFLATLAAVVGVANELMALPFGYLADRRSRVWMMRLGTLAANAGSVVQGVAPSIPVLVAGRATSGVALAATQPASFSLIADYFRSAVRARAFAFFYAAAQLSQAIAPAAVGALALAIGWRGAVTWLGAAAVAVSLLTFLLREPVRGSGERADLGASPDLVSAEPEPIGFGEAYRAMASIPTLRRIWYVTPISLVTTSGALLLLPFYYSEVHYLDVRQRGLVQTGNALLGLILILIGGRYADRILRERPGRLMTIGAAVFAYQALSYLLLAISPNLLVSLLISVPATAVPLALAPAFLTMISLIVPPRARGLGVQTQAPWRLLGILATPAVVAVITAPGAGIQRGMLVFVPLYLVGAAISASAAPHVGRDIERARKAALDGLAVAEADELPALVVRGLEVEIDGTQILDGVDLEVASGELLALLGTNGAGKSTVLRALAGLHHASAGLVLVNGRDTTYLAAADIAAHGVHLLAGGQAVVPGLTVGEHLALAAAAPGRAADAPTIEDVLTIFPELASVLDQAATALSGGQQQVVGLAMAFVVAPRVLLVDELSMGLAPHVVERLLVALRDLAGRGSAVILVEQSLNVAASVADRAIFLDRGEVRFQGTVPDLLARPDLVRAVFLGGSGSLRRRRRGVAEDTAVLAVRDATVRFGGLTALDRVSVEVRPGEVVGIIGPNGAGKTTLFDVISGFAALAGGTVEIAGTDATELPTHGRAALGLGRSFQRARLFPTMTVADTVATFAHRRTAGGPLAAALWLPSARASERRTARLVEDLLDTVGLSDLATSRVGELSTGQRRIVDLACVLAQGPRVLLLDEPSTGLAQAEVEALGPLIARLVSDLGCGVLLIEHDVPLVAAVSDRIVAMATGQVIAAGAPREVLADPAVVRAYLSATERSLQRTDHAASDLLDTNASDLLDINASDLLDAHRDALAHALQES